MPAESPTAAFAQKFGTKYGLDITMIVALITALAKIFENCPKPPASEVKSPGLRHRVRATRIVMDEMDSVSRREARHIANNLLVEAQAEDDATVDAVAEECCSGTFS